MQTELARINISCDVCHELIINDGLIDARLIPFIRRSIKCPDKIHESKEGKLQRRTVVIQSGADWYYASYEILEIPPDLDLTKERDIYNQLGRSGKVGSKTFVEWLKACGAKDADGIEYFDFEFND